MRVILAIANQTIKSSLRSKVFGMVFVLVLICTFVLPVNSIGDGTLKGLYQIRLNYSLGVITVLISMAALWVSTTTISTEIEEYHIHMIFTKPVSPMKLWLGKWLGVVTISGILLIVCTSLVYFLINYDVKQVKKEIINQSITLLNECKKSFTDEEKRDPNIGGKLNEIYMTVKRFGSEKQLKRLKDGITDEIPEEETLKSRIELLTKRTKELSALLDEVITGRIRYEAEHPDYRKVLKAKIKEKIGGNKELTEGEELILKKLARNEVVAKFTNIPFGGSLTWEFKNLPVLDEKELAIIRFKVYKGSTTTSGSTRKETRGLWGLKYPTEESAEGEEGADKREQSLQYIQFVGIEGKEQTVLFPVGFINKETKSVKIEYRNLDQDKKNALIPLSEGPFLMLKGVSFGQNFFRCTFLLFMMICFMAIIGCSTGSCFSSPVAIFVSFSYLVIGFLILTLADSAQEMQGNEAKSIIQTVAFFMQDRLQWFMISVDNFNKTEFLTSGRAITSKIIYNLVFIDLFLKGVPLAVLSIAVLNRRQMALVERK